MGHPSTLQNRYVDFRKNKISTCRIKEYDWTRFKGYALHLQSQTHPIYILISPQFYVNKKQKSDLAETCKNLED